MKKYKDWSPSRFDARGLNLPDRQEWLVAPVIQTRDSGPLERSNFRVVRLDLEKVQAEDGDPSAPDEPDVEVHRFGHWGPGWFEIILVRPGSPAAKKAEEWEAALSDYPVASEEDFSKEEWEEAVEVWQSCYSDRERLEYIREHRSEFEFRNWMELIHTVRGTDFRGCASELLG